MSKNSHFQYLTQGTKIKKKKKKKMVQWIGKIKNIKKKSWKKNNDMNELVMDFGQLGVD